MTSEKHERQRALDEGVDDDRVPRAKARPTRAAAESNRVNNHARAEYSGADPAAMTGEQRRLPDAP
jgi:hypothetical protein